MAGPGMTYFHGGVPGLYPGDVLRPPAVTGVESQADFGNPLTDRGRVYATTDLRYAGIMAGTYRVGRGVVGDVYEVELLGPVEPDPDWGGEPGGSVATTHLLIVRVVPVRQWHPRAWAS